MDKEFQRLIKLHKSAYVVQLVMLAKGLIGPGDIRFNGAITPQRARTFISLVYAEDFLSKITREVMTTLQKEGAVIDIPQRSLRRVPQGQLPTDEQKTGIVNFNYKLVAQDQQLFVDVLFDYLRDNQDNPNLVTELEAAFATRIRGELTDLAFNGTGLDADGEFLKLNKGFLALAEAGCPAGQKLAIDPDTNGWIDELGRMLLALPAIFHEGAKLVMNTLDAVEYALEVGRHVTGSSAIADQQVSALLAYPIEKVTVMPRRHVLLTPLKNMVIGVNTDITRSAEVRQRERCIWYTWDLSVDFELAAKQAVVYGRPG